MSETTRRRSLDELRAVVAGAEATKVAAEADLLVTACLIVDYTEDGRRITPTLWNLYHRQLDKYGDTRIALAAAHAAVDAEHDRLTAGLATAVRV